MSLQRWIVIGFAPLLAFLSYEVVRANGPKGQALSVPLASLFQRYWLSLAIVRDSAEKNSGPWTNLVDDPCPNAYARLLFVDFSSAFNLIQPDILLRKLVELKFNPFLIRWYHSFLSNRPQQVKFNLALSDPAVCSTGAPQGCISSPFLFTIYTNDCFSSEPNQHIVQFSDDSVILSLLTKNTNISVHRAGVDKFVNWCNQLHINTKKALEMLVDPRSVGDQSTVTIHGADIKQVTSFKYLGVHIDSDLSWRAHVADVCARTHQRLHFLRRLSVWGQ